VLPLLVKVSDRSLPLQPYEPCSGEDVTGLVTPATVTVASSVTAETGKQFLEAEISSPEADGRGARGCVRSAHAVRAPGSHP
jgi:hypothetical protein